jgi:hypothetical protein
MRDFRAPAKDVESVVVITDLLHRTLEAFGLLYRWALRRPIVELVTLPLIYTSCFCFYLILHNNYGTHLLYERQSSTASNRSIKCFYTYSQRAWSSLIAITTLIVSCHRQKRYCLAYRQTASNLENRYGEAYCQIGGTCSRSSPAWEFLISP